MTDIIKYEADLKALTAVTKSKVADRLTPFELKKVYNELTQTQQKIKNMRKGLRLVFDNATARKAEIAKVLPVKERPHVGRPRK